MENLDITKEILDIIEKKLQEFGEKLKDYFNSLFDKNNLVFVIIFLVSLLLAFFYIIYYINPYNIKDNKFSIIFVLIFIFFELQILFFFINSYDKDYYTKYKLIFKNSIIIIAIVLFIIYFLFFISNRFIGKNGFTNVLLVILQIFLVITSLSIIYLLSQNIFIKEKASEIDENNMSDKNYRFIKNLIFFIPCVLIDLIENFGKFFGTTPNIGYVLLVLTIILVLLIIYLPNYIDKLVNGSSLILKGPVYLNKKKNLGVFQQFTEVYGPNLIKDKTNIKLGGYELDLNFEQLNKEIPFSYKYEIHSEIFINPQPVNTNYSYNVYTNLLNYGNKPKIEYLGKENKIKVTCQTYKNENEVIYESTISNNDYFKLAKWNKIIISYDGANMDVFINSYLVGTKQNVLPHMNYDEIIIGEEDGIYGSIKNVYFINKSKKQMKVENSDFTN